MEKFKVGDIVIGKQVNIKAASGVIHHVFTPDYKREIAEIKEDKIRLQSEWDANLWFYAKDFKLIRDREAKEIIGYKLIKPEYEEAALKITGMLNQHWTGFSDNRFLKTEKWTCVGYKDHVAKLKKAGVLDLWFEPVYKQEKQIIQMYSSNKGEFEIEIIDGKAYYRPENKELSKQWIYAIIKSFENQYAHPLDVYPISVSAVKVGCMEGTRKEDWEKVYKFLK